MLETDSNKQSAGYELQSNVSYIIDKAAMQNAALWYPCNNLTNVPGYGDYADAENVFWKLYK